MSKDKLLLPLQIARVVLAAALLGTLAAQAAKNPDKPEKPDKVEKPARMEKMERKLERAAMAQAAETPERRPAAAASQPIERANRVDQRNNRVDRSNAGAAEARQAAATPADAKFDNFRLIIERNIFNPNRVGRVRAGSEERAPHIDTIALVGTMQSDKGVMAFFDSPDSAFRKALREGQSVGEFKVKKIRPDGVDLERNGEPLALRVAQQLVKPEGGDWKVSAVEPLPPETGGAPASGGRPIEITPPAIPANASETLRRLMEQRQKQLKQ